MAGHFAAMILLGLFWSSSAHTQSTRDSPESQSLVRRDTAFSSVNLSFKDFFELGAKELRPAARLLALNGQRVRLIGFMVQMEDPPIGAFYLCPRPILADESGGGTADLPPESVLVIVASSDGKKVSFIPGALEVTGLLQVQRREEADGRISFIRLLLDRPEARASSSADHSTKENRKSND